MNPDASAANEAILVKVENLGGGYVWEPEIFAITLMDVALTDEQACVLTGLSGVEQIAINASRLTLPALQAIAGIPGLKSLVLSRSLLSAEQRQLLEKIGPEIQVVNDEQS